MSWAGPGQADTLKKSDGPGRAGPGIFENVMGWAGPRPMLGKIDGPGRAAAHQMYWKFDGPGRAGPRPIT